MFFEAFSGFFSLSYQHCHIRFAASDTRTTSRALFVRRVTSTAKLPVASATSRLKTFMPRRIRLQCRRATSSYIGKSGSTRGTSVQGLTRRRKRNVINEYITPEEAEIRRWGGTKGRPSNRRLQYAVFQHPEVCAR